MKGADHCPRCGDENVMTFRKIGEGFSRNHCMGCKTIWEPFDEDLLLDHDEPLSSFTKPCNNCAFRKDSPEREDKEKWALMIATFETYPPTVFICHKGVPLSEDAESHDHPKGPDGRVDIEQARYCRGWLNHQRGIKLKALKVIGQIREGKHASNND